MSDIPHIHQDYIDIHTIGAIQDRLVRLFQVSPDNLKSIQNEIDRISKEQSLPYLIRATIRRSASGHLDQLHLVKRLPRAILTAS